MSSKEYDKLLPVIKSFPEVNARAQQSLLGYSGIMINAGTKRIYVFKEVITIAEGKLVKGYADKASVIEKLLLQSAPVIIQQEIKGMLPEGLR